MSLVTRHMRRHRPVGGSAPPATFVPNNPSGLAAGTPGSTTIPYTFTASVVDGSHDAATSYQLQTRQPAGSGSYSNNGAAFSGTSCTATGLSASTSTDARVQAINSVGTSAGFSNVATATTSAAVQHWYKIGEEGETVVGVVGNMRFGTARIWSPSTPGGGATVVATSANFGTSFDSTKTKQLQSDSETYASRHYKIMALGDSITASDSPVAGWRLVLQELSAYAALDKKPLDFVGNAPLVYNNIAPDMDHNGYSGYRSTDLTIGAGGGTGPGYPGSPPYYADARDLDDWFVGTAANLVILHLGTNDLAGVDGSVSTSTVLAGYSLLLDRARVQNPNVVFVVAQIIGIGSSFPGGDARVIALNAAIPGWAAAHTTGPSPIVVVDQHTGFDPATMTADGIHPNSTGALQMAERFFTAITPYISVGATALERIAGWGANVDWPNPISYNQMFTDLIKSSAGIWVQTGSASGFDATTGWPTGVAAGSVLRTVLKNGLGQPGYYYLRPGVYKARLSSAAAAAGWTVQFDEAAGSGKITPISAAGATATCTVVDRGADGDYSGLLFGANFHAPLTGGPYSAVDICQIYLQSNEAWLDGVDSGANYFKIFEPGFLSDLAGIKCIRVKDMMGTDSVQLPGGPPDSAVGDRRKHGICAWSEVTTEAYMTWQMGGYMALFGHVPVSVCAKLGRYLGCGLHINMPLMHNMTSFDVVSGAISAVNHDYGPGDKVVFGGSFLPIELSPWTPYFVRDVVSRVSFKVSATVGGAAIVFSVPNAANGATFDCNVYKLYTEVEIQTFYDRIAQEFHDNAPDVDCIVDVGNENWSGFAAPYGYNQCYRALSMYTTTPGFASAGYAWILMRAWTAFEKVYPRGQIIRTFQGQGAFFGVSGGFGYYGYQYHDPTMFSDEILANLIDAHCCEAYSYGSLTGHEPKNVNDLDWPEMGYGITGTDYDYWNSPQDYKAVGTFGTEGDVVHMLDGNNYRCKLDHSGHPPPNATYWEPWPTEPSNLLIGAGASWTDTQCKEYGRVTVKFRAQAMARYKVDADSLRTNPTPAGWVCYEAGFYLGNRSGGPLPGSLAFGHRWNAFMKTAKFQEVVQLYYEQMLRDVGVDSFCQFFFAGQWRAGDNSSSNTGDVVWFGLKRSHHEPDTPASTYMKTLTSMT